MTMKCMQYVLATGLLLSLFLFGCFQKVGHIVSTEGKPTRWKDTPGVMLSKITTSDQARMFGPFPCWKEREGAYQYQSFVMRYLLNGKTQLSDTHRSWVAALYRDAETPNRYLLKFAVRHRLSESDKWQTDDEGDIFFYLNGDKVHFGELDESAKQMGTIDISIGVDMKSRRYLKIKITDHGWYDELRTFIGANGTV